MLLLRSSNVVRQTRRTGLALALLLTAGIGHSLAADLRVPSTSYPNIQAAIDAAAPGDTVLVADGTYAGAGNTLLNFFGKNITVRSEGGAGKCIIDGEGAAPGFLFISGETAEAVVDGFTVRRGQFEVGSGVAIMEASPTIRNCVFEQNAGSGGGAVFAVFSSSTFTNCTFIGNRSTQGGAVYSVYSNSTFANCTFKSNTALQGGALFVYGGVANVVNGVLQGNRADEQGGAVYADSSLLNVTHGTLTGNVSGVGGGVFLYGGLPTFANSVLWGNSAPQIDGFADVSVSYSLVQGGFAGEANVNADPLFTAPDDLRLRSGSPGIDAGTAAAPFLPATDLDGNVRVFGLAPDMGAYEAAEVPDTTAPVIGNVSVTPNVLTQPNHKMRDVAVLYTVTDNRDDAPTFSLSAVSNEPDNGDDDGNTTCDIKVVSEHHVRLRAERSESGSGRVYTITITATDAAGNTATKEVTVTVPK